MATLDDEMQRYLRRKGTRQKIDNDFPTSGKSKCTPKERESLYKHICWRTSRDKFLMGRGYWRIHRCDISLVKADEKRVINESKNSPRDEFLVNAVKLSLNRDEVNQYVSRRLIKIVVSRGEKNLNAVGKMTTQETLMFRKRTR